jgi:hypothetical protein
MIYLTSHKAVHIPLVRPAASENLMHSDVLHTRNKYTASHTHHHFQQHLRRHDVDNPVLGTIYAGPAFAADMGISLNPNQAKENVEKIARDKKGTPFQAIARCIVHRLEMLQMQPTKLNFSRILSTTRLLFLVTNCSNTKLQCRCNQNAICNLQSL